MPLPTKHSLNFCGVAHGGASLDAEFNAAEAH
jgi:hypothetical protein